MRRADFYGSRGSLKRTADAVGESSTGSFQKMRYDRTRRRDDGDEVSTTDRVLEPSAAEGNRGGSGSRPRAADFWQTLEDNSATRLYEYENNEPGDARTCNTGSRNEGSQGVRVPSAGGGRDPDRERNERERGTPRVASGDGGRGLERESNERERGTPRVRSGLERERERGTPRVPSGLERESNERERGNPLDARSRLHYEDLVKENKTIREQLTLLVETANMTLKSHKPETPDCCKWERVKKKLTTVVGKLLLGSENFCDLFPPENTVVEAILAAFDVSGEEEKVDMFYKAWGSTKGNNLRTKVMENIRNRRGEFTKQLREELYLQLGHSKPRCTATAEEEQAWLRVLRHLYSNGGWKNNVNEDGTEDPWGSKPVYKAMSRIWRGTTYEGHEVLPLTIQQAGFCFTVLDLAMNGQRLSDFSAKVQIRKMKDMEDTVLSQKDLLKNFRIIC